MKERVLISLGLWRAEYFDPDEKNALVDSFPMPLEFLPYDWEPGLKKRVVRYLREAPIFQNYLGDDLDDLGLAPPPPTDYSEKSDGKWVWPGNFWYFIEELNLPLPEEFVADMASRNFTPPQTREELGVLGVKLQYDTEFWPRWARNHTRRKPA